MQGSFCLSGIISDGFYLKSVANDNSVDKTLHYQQYLQIVRDIHPSLSHYNYKYSCSIPCS